MGVLLHLCVRLLQQGGPQLPVVGRGAVERLVRARLERDRVVDHDLVPDAVLVELERVKAVLCEVVADDEVQQQVLSTTGRASGSGSGAALGFRFRV